jgi:hypothetical protein
MPATTAAFAAMTENVLRTDLVDNLISRCLSGPVRDGIDTRKTSANVADRDRTPLETRSNPN